MEGRRIFFGREYFTLIWVKHAKTHEIEGIEMFFLKRFLTAVIALTMGICTVFAEGRESSAELSFYLPPYTYITPTTSPVLTANITDRSGNLFSPLMTRFRVITNNDKEQTLYLKSNVITDGGYEESMFIQGGQVYIAFANLRKPPKSSALASCKMGGMPDDSPGVVAYPVTSIIGAKHKFIPGKNKYEVYIGSGTTDVTVNIGQNVLRNSFGRNDPRGFYQAVLSLTEADI